jgi:hypothetical protein
MASQVRRTTASLVLLGGVALMTACGSPSSAGTDGPTERRTSAPDCPAEVRYHGVGYTAYRLIRLEPTRLGHAQPVCAGSRQGAGAGPVTVWRVPGQPPSKVIGRASEDGRYAVYVADSVLPDERARVLTAVRSARR